MLSSAVAFVAVAAVAVSQNRPVNVATTPADRLSDQWWKDRHAQKLEVTKKGGIELAFLGDSITHSWEGPGKAVWDHYYGHRRAANFGFSGDRTEHVLWRLDHGELIPAKPKVVVLMIGTNNVGQGSSNPEQAADGVGAIVDRLKAGIPGVRILLLAVFPRSLNPQDKLRHDVAEISDRIKKEADGKSVVYLDIGKYFLRPSGEMRTLLMPDMLHPNENGYMIWAKAMEPTLSRMLGDKPVPPM
ncbi:MAG TPA: GDSL-type esterase/lipase family protein [Fimbriimonadaceae bacterium]|nr:GDSL-type esterase/lipase family protein [Fimbriimonadaceae bacterium]